MRSKSIRGAIAGILCTIVVAAISVQNETYFGAEWLIRDWIAARLAAHRPPDPRIVIVAVSEQTTRVLAEFYGRPQSYSRDLYASAIDELRRAGAKLVVFDVFFGEENLTDPEGDRNFAAALSTMPVVLGADTKSGARRAPPPEFASKLWQADGLPSPPLRADFPYIEFHGAAGVGTTRISLASTSESARVHDYPLLDVTNGGAMPSVALEAWREVIGAGRRASWTRAINGGRLRIGNASIPTENDATLTIRWNGAKQKSTDLSYRAIDFDKVLIAAMSRAGESTGVNESKLREFEAQFKDKIVIIGFTAAGLHDLRATPLSPTSAGVEIHANALDNLLNHDFNVVVNRWLVFPFIAIIAAALGALLDYIRRQIAAGAAALLFIAGALAVIYAFANGGRLLPAFATVASLALTYVALTVVNFIAEQQQTAVLRTTFGRYVSPQILDHILAHPEKVHLGGERRDLTILFSDIRGFTSISEAAEPEEVVDMLNEYLTRMVEILLAHGGTLDKFIGDAVMGFWNAPAADPDHPKHAVACAIEMIQETARIRERWIGEGKAALRIGIGINSGDAVVGNIGAEKVFGYTVIGDAVNLASRLEGKNKDYGTEIIVSEFTRERIGDAFETVYLDEVKVKGKERAVKIYEVRS